jgi:hypothetical protein
MKSVADSPVPASPQFLLRLEESLRLLCRRLEQNFDQQRRLDRFVALAQDRWELQSHQFQAQVQQIEAAINTWLSAPQTTPRLAVIPVPAKTR